MRVAEHRAVDGARCRLQTVLVDPDFDAARLLGYLDLAGKFRPSEFTKEVLETGQPLVPRVVIFEECNTAQLEAYAGQLLHAVESSGAVQLLPRDRVIVRMASGEDDEVRLVYRRGVADAVHRSRGEAEYLDAGA